jgi:hypothetical protein
MGTYWSAEKGNWQKGAKYSFAALSEMYSGNQDVAYNFVAVKINLNVVLIKPPIQWRKIFSKNRSE